MQEKKIYILPFDHRASIFHDLLGFSRPLNKKQILIVEKYKSIIYRGFLEIYQIFPKKEQLGILIDEEFGTEIITDAKKKKINFCLAVEKSGQEIFDFEYGVHFQAHLKKFKPTYAKVLIRYNPDNAKDNKIQKNRLKKLVDFCVANKQKLMIELLVLPNEKEKLDLVEYDSFIRPKKTLLALNELLAYGINADIWKLEAFDRARDWYSILRVLKKYQKSVQIIVLGRAESKTRVYSWLKIASIFSEIIGFAVGRTIFYPILLNYKEKKITEKQAIKKIARAYADLILFWQKNKLKSKNIWQKIKMSLVIF